MTREDTTPSSRLLAVIQWAEPRLREVPAEVAARRPSPHAWSPLEIVGHLVDSASNNHQRFVRASFQDDLLFPGYNQDTWVSAQRYVDTDWGDLITLVSAFNRHIAHVMAHLPEGVRLRVHQRHNLDALAFHPPPRASDATLQYFMMDYVHHLEHHLQQIFGPNGRLAAYRETPAPAP